MALDLEKLRAAIAEHGRVVRVVIASISGSSPREVGASMLVWADGQSGTIGGGALEHQAANQARSAEANMLTRHALGPELGQCCGGAVTLFTEIWGAAELLAQASREVIARPTEGATEMPLGVRRHLDAARAQGRLPNPELIQGWFVEPVHRPSRKLWIWGAGHVGRAIVHTLAPLPDFAITWVDIARARFPADIPDCVTVFPAQDPARAVSHTPIDAQHLILTYSHELDLALCHALLKRGFATAGLIGSETKWARFRKRLAQLGHSDAQIMRIRCPIGRKHLGKHPQAIAVGIATTLLEAKTDGETETWPLHSSISGA